MKQAHFQLILAAFALIGVHGAAMPVCLAGELESNCNCGSNYWSDGCVCRFCDRCSYGCDKICQFRLIDGCTKCAWSRTWNAPNALATPLRQYYVPRPAQCCWYNGCEACMANPGGAAWEMSADTNCQNRTNMISTEVAPEVAVGFGPPQFERLGKIHNELDVIGPAAAPAPSRGAAPSR
jgi:hypothetical protein